MKKLLARLAELLRGSTALVPLGRMRTCDVAVAFQLPQGFAGDVNRTHPASIQPCLVDPDDPPTSFGQAVVVDAVTGGVRALTTADSALTDIWGVTVRTYPFQQQTAANYGAVGFGGGGPATTQPVDVMTAGYIFVPVVGASKKGASVFLWIAAPSGAHVTGGFEAVSSGSTLSLDPEKFKWNSPPDANGVAELLITL